MIISSLSAISPRIYGSASASVVSARRSKMLFAMCTRFCTAVVKFRKEGKTSLLDTMREEKRKSLKFAYSLISSSAPQTKVRSAFTAAGLLPFTGLLPAGALPSAAVSPLATGSPLAATLAESCEAEMLIAGTLCALDKAHPIVLMRTMTAFLGPSVFSATEKWLLEQYGHEDLSDEELIIPGDLPEIVMDPGTSEGQLNLAVRLAGPQLVAAACAGCPREAIRRIKSAAYTTLGSALIDDEIKNARNRLSSDELADAQNAFHELIESIREEERSVQTSSEEAERAETIDQGLIADISTLILEMDEKLLRTVVSNIDPAIVASMIQGMEPLAHDRLFSCIASYRGKKILDALEASMPLSSVEITRMAQIFAQRVLSEIAPKSKTLGRTLTLPAQVRASLTSLLSRE